MRSRQSTKDFLTQIEAASRNPMGWAILPGTRVRAAVRVTVLCTEGADRVWVRHRGDGVNLELVDRAALTSFVAYEQGAPHKAGPQEKEMHGKGEGPGRR